MNPVDPAAGGAPNPQGAMTAAVAALEAALAAGDGDGENNNVAHEVMMGPRGPDAVKGQLLRHFTDQRRTPGFHFVRFLGQGTYGAAALVTDARAGAGPPRKLVVKRGFGKAGQWGVKREIEYLKVVRGGEHFAQLLAYRDRLDDDPVRELRELFRRRGRYLQGLPGPTLVTDYVENGTFNDFYTKVCAWERHVPNRLLWSILLCGKRPKEGERENTFSRPSSSLIWSLIILVSGRSTGIRMCIGMSWPCMAPHKAPTRTERIDAPQRAPILLEHNDIHMNNGELLLLTGQSLHGEGDFADRTLVAKPEGGGERDHANLWRV